MLRITLFGQFGLHLGDKQIEIASRPAKTLFVFLLLNRTVTHRRERLAGVLWPEHLESSARQSLRNALWQLRQAIGDEYLLVDKTSLAFNTAAPHTLDVDILESLSEAENPDALIPVVSVYKGDLLPGFYEDWILLERERLRMLYERQMQKLLDQLCDAKRWYEVQIWAENWIALGHVPEPAYRTLMMAYSALGDRAGIANSYQRCVQALKDQLNVSPSPETQELYKQLSETETSLLHHTQPIQEAKPKGTPAQVEVPRDILPTYSTPFFGRQDELLEISRLLQKESDCRLLTLVGPGGTGKTRLALAAANEIQFADGIRFIPLAAIGSRGSLVHAITDSLHLQLHSSADAREQLFAHLQQHKLLLILDNFEHLLSPSGHKEGSNQDSIALVIDILEHAPDVRILVTSRERLNLSAEWVFNVEGLQTPSLAEGYDNLKVENFSAVQLFLQRACQLKRDFGKGQDELTCVARICHLAGGLPLAIELAAAWVNTLSCREILQEIERSLKFLRTNLRDYPERHRDMRAVFDTSWNMLTDSEQQLFRRLSVFRGGFNRVAAEAVGGKIKWTEEDLSLEPEGTLQLGKRQPEVLAALAGLVDKSFVQQPLNGRYEIHELMRQYGAAKLLERPDDEKKSRNTHTRYYLTLLEHQEKPLRGAEQRLILEKLVPEIENIKVAWKWAVTSQQLGWLVQMLPGLLWLFELRNDYQDAAALTLNAAETFRSKLGLDTTDNPVERNHFTFLLSQAGWFAFLSGQTERGRMLSDEAFSLAGPEGRPVHLWHMNSERGYMELAVGNFGKARHYSQKGLAYAKRLTDPWYLGYPLAHLGMISLGEGKPQDAYDRLKESLAIWSDIGDQRGLIFTYTHLGTATLSLGRSEEALTYAENSLALSIDTDDRWSQANALNLIGQVQASRGDYEMAKISFQKSAKLHREVGDIRNMAQTQVKLGNAAFDAEKNKQAKTAFLEALSAAKQAQVVATGLEALLGLARIEARRNRFEWAHSLGIYVAKHTQGNQYIRDAAKQVCVEIEKRVEFKGSNESKDQFQGNTFEEVVKSIQVEST